MKLSNENPYSHGFAAKNVTFCIRTQPCFNPMKVRKTVKIRKRYNQVPHLTQVTTLESNKNTINITYKSKEVSPFPPGDHEAAMNRRESMRNTRRINTTDSQKMYRLGTVSKIFYWRA